MKVCNLTDAQYVSKAPSLNYHRPEILPDIKVVYASGVKLGTSILPWIASQGLGEIPRLQWTDSWHALSW
jgi:hypothetical protein